MSKKSAISGVILVMGLVALGGKAYHDNKQEQERIEQQLEEAVDIYPLNGVFTCSYYKSTTVKLEGITHYETSETARGRNWLFIVEDGTAIFYTQTAGHFCHVEHVEEE